MSESKEIRIKVENGTLVAYANETEQNAGIVFIPDGTDEEIDIAYAYVSDENGTPAWDGPAETLAKLNIAAYGDITTENATYEAVIDTGEAKKMIENTTEP